MELPLAFDQMAHGEAVHLGLKTDEQPILKPMDLPYAAPTAGFPRSEPMQGKKHAVIQSATAIVVRLKRRAAL
jgi:hypothetical protein